MLAENPAGVFASLQYLADTKLGRHIQVFMPYSDALRDIADWFVQLWAESLGKHRSPGDKGVGPTPLGALGATDQHSKVQLFMEGPPDKTVTFIAVTEGGVDLTIPKLHSDVKELATSADIASASCCRSSSRRPPARWRGAGDRT